MIITIRQLQLVHYSYFMFGIFSFVSAILLGLESIASQLFLAFYCMNSAISWYVAYVTRKRMSKYVIVQSMSYFLMHTLATLVTVAVTVSVWLLEVIPDLDLLHGIIAANYFVTILAGMWYAATRIEPVRRLFTVYDSYVFQKSRGFMAGLRHANKGFFGLDIASEKDISSYEFGKIKEVDSNMVQAWRNREKRQFCLECLARVEIALANESLKFIRNKIAYMRMLPASRADERLLRWTENELLEKKADIMRFEKGYYRKSGESF
jgi:hypothetical protein